MPKAVKKIGLFVLCFISLFITSFSISAQTLRQVVLHAIKTNPEPQVKFRGWQASREGVYQAIGGYLPKLDVDANAGQERYRDITTDFDDNRLDPRGVDVTLTENIFNGFATTNELARTKNRTLAQGYVVESSTNDIALIAIEAYLNVMRTKEIWRLSQQNYKNHYHTYIMVKHRAGTGLGRKADVAQSFGRLALAKSNLLAANNNYINAKTIFYKVIGYMPKNLATPSGPKPVSLPKTMSQAVNSAIDGNPAMKSAKADIQEAQAQHRAARANFWPHVDLVGVATKGHDLNRDEGRYDNYAGFVRVNYNLFNGGSDKARLSETAYQEEQAKQIRNDVYDKLVEKMQTTWNDYVTAKNQISYLTKHKDAAILTAKMYEIQFKVGHRRLLDVLDGQREQFIAETNFVNGKYNLLFTKYRLLNAEGRLLGYLNISTSYLQQIHKANGTSLYVKENTTKAGLN